VFFAIAKDKVLKEIRLRSALVFGGRGQTFLEPCRNAKADRYRLWFFHKSSSACICIVIALAKIAVISHYRMVTALYSSQLTELRRSKWMARRKKSESKGIAPKTRDYFAELYVAGMMGDRGLGHLLSKARYLL